jgi:hypothetical protein
MNRTLAWQRPLRFAIAAQIICIQLAALCESRADPPENSTETPTMAASKRSSKSQPFEKEICDFANSYLTFGIKGVNSARINLDARCLWINEKDQTSEEFVLICPCQGEHMYPPAKRGYIQDPPFNFSGVFSKTHNHLIRTLADADVNRDTVEKHTDRFTTLKIDVAVFKKAVELTEDKAIVEATLRNLPLIGRTELQSEDGQFRAIMEYPVTTMNVEPEKNIWQVDTGPVLFPDFNRKAGQLVEQLIPAFTVYDSRTYAEFTLRSIVKLPAGGSVHHYGDIRRLNVKNRLYRGE